MKTLTTLALICSLLVPAAHAAKKHERDDCVTRFESCEAVLRELQADPNTAIPSGVLANARGLIITNQFKAGLMLGFTGGYGVVMVRRDDGSWSIPVLIRAGGASLGLQAGGSTIERVIVLTSSDTARQLYDRRFNIGVDALAVAGPHDSEAEKNLDNILDAKLLVYSKKQGIYAGANIKTGWLSRWDAPNRAYYQTPYGLPEMLYGNFVAEQPEVRPLIDYVTQITR